MPAKQFLACGLFASRSLWVIQSQVLLIRHVLRQYPGAFLWPFGSGFHGWCFEHHIGVPFWKTLCNAL